jgi:hypothetical protein
LKFVRIKKFIKGSIIEKSIEDTNQKTKKIPAKIAKSLIRLTINAFNALEIAFTLVYQKPIKR